MTFPEKELPVNNRDQEVWEAYQAGRSEAFSDLYELYFDRLFIYGCSITSDRSFVKDAVQEIFLKLIQRDQDLMQIQNIRSYLFVALRNFIRKELHTRERKRFHNEQYIDTVNRRAEDWSPVMDEGRPDFAEALQKEIRLLPGRQREILYLRFFEGLDYKEISEIIGVNHQVTRNYAYRGVKRIRKRMEGIHKIFFSLGIGLALVLLSWL